MTENSSRSLDGGGPRDLDLLFGVMAVQLQLITARDLAEAAAVWATEPGAALGAILVRLGKLDETKRALIGQLLEVQVARHGDAGATLRSFGGERAVVESFGPAAAGPGVAEAAEPDHTLPSFGGDRWNGPGADLAPVTLIDDTMKVTAEQGGRYAFRGEAGHGAMGQVLVAFDEHVGREVAVKELLPDPGCGSLPSRATPSSGTTPAAARFLREARITGQLEHPGIVPVYEIGRRPDGVIYYTMKLVRGQTLSDRLKDIKVRGPRSGVRGEEGNHGAAAASSGTARTADLSSRLQLLPNFLDLCQSMAYAHSKGVVHRDLKPANVMIGEFGETVVLDWGLAKVRGIEDVREGDLEENLRLIKEATAGDTVRGKPIGTPAYMSPEQAEGDIPNIDERSDVWSLGAVLFELLTGRPPFIGSSAYEVMGKVMMDPLPDAAALEPKAPAELIAIANKCLAKDRMRRYASAAELAADVLKFQSGGLVSAYEYSMTALAGRWLRKRWPVVSTAAAAVVVLLALAVYSYLEIGREKDLALEHERTALTEKARAEDRERESRLNLAEAYYQMGVQAEKKNLWNEARLFYARSLDLNEREPARSGYYMAAVRPVSASLLRSLPASEQSVMGAAFSPDGRLIASASCAEKQSGMCVLGEWKIWDAATGALVRTARDHADYIKTARFSPDGGRLLTASWDNTIKVWSVETGACLLTLRGHEDDVYDAAWSPDGKLIASAGYDGMVRLWDAASGAVVHEFPRHEFTVYAVAFTPDGRGLITGGGDANVEQWSLETFEKVRTLAGHTYIVEAVAVSPDGKFAVSGGWDKMVKVWSLTTGECVRTLTGHEDRVYTVGFSPDGRYIFSGGLDQTLMLWDAASGENVLSIGAGGQVQAAAFSLAGDRLVMAGSDHTVKLWSLTVRAPVRTATAAGKILWTTTVSPDGSFAAWAGSDDSLTASVRLWPLSDDGPGRVFDPQPYPYLTLAAGPDGKRLVTGGCRRNEGFDCFTGELKLWDVDSGTVTTTLVGHDGVVNAVAFSPDNAHAASGSCADMDLTRGCIKGDIIIWDLASGDTVLSFPAHDNWVSSLVYTPDGKRLLSSGGFDATLKLWDAATGACLQTFRGHTNLINAIAMAPDGKRAASASFDNTIKLWDLETGREIRTITGHDVGVKGVDFSPDGKFLVSGGWDHKIKLWDAQSGRCLLTISGHAAAVAATLFSRDGQSVIASDDDNLIKVWPLSWDLLTARPEELLAATRRETGLDLDGFKLMPLAP